MRGCGATRQFCLYAVRVREARADESLADYAELVGEGTECVVVGFNVAYACVSG